MSCHYYNNGICLLASKLIDKECPVSKEQCEYCINISNKPKDINKVTVSIALKHTDDRNDILSKYGNIINYTEIPHNQKTGTALKNLISWFIWDKEVQDCRTCRNREELMNKWGADRCEKNINIIVSWLKDSAKEKGYLFSERIAKALVNKAIRNSRT